MKYLNKKKSERKIFFYLISVSPESNCNNDTLVASSRSSIPSYDRFENTKEHHGSQLNSTSLAFTSQVNSQVPQTTSTANDGDAFICQVYMREADLNRAMKNGHVFINQGRFHFTYEE